MVSFVLELAEILFLETGMLVPITRQSPNHSKALIPLLRLDSSSGLFVPMPPSNEHPESGLLPLQAYNFYRLRCQFATTYKISSAIPTSRGCCFLHPRTRRDTISILFLQRRSLVHHLLVPKPVFSPTSGPLMCHPDKIILTGRPLIISSDSPSAQVNFSKRWTKKLFKFSICLQWESNPRAGFPTFLLGRNLALRRPVARLRHVNPILFVLDYLRRNPTSNSKSIP